MATHGPDRQTEIYMQGTETTIAPEDWERQARAALPETAFGYLAGGAGAEDTMRANLEAFRRWRIWPHMLRDVADRDLTTQILGTSLPAPFLLAPVGVLSIVHPEAELPAARAAAAAGVPLIVSTVSSVPLEKIAAEMGDGSRWFQLYAGKDPEVMASMVRRAEAAGYSALVVTLDTTLIGWRERDLHLAYLPFLAGQGFANFLSDPVFRSRLSEPAEENPLGAVLHFLQIFGDPAFTWERLRGLRDVTGMPILLKGILRPDDAERAVEEGMDGLIVSNHGGRQVDGGVAALDALVAIRDAVGDRLPLLMDSGIRRGADVVKALALGAQAVLLGRPYVYALAATGEDGVRQVIRNLTAEIDLQMALSGCRSIGEIDRSLVAEVGQLPLQAIGS